VKGGTGLHALFVLQMRFNFHRRPNQALQKAQLKATAAVHVILQVTLAELEIRR
jgi:hypothetical protein